jgi:hypothetical protein
MKIDCGGELLRNVSLTKVDSTGEGHAAMGGQSLIPLDIWIYALLSGSV